MFVRSFVRSRLAKNFKTQNMICIRCWMQLRATVRYQSDKTAKELSFI